MAQPLKHPFDKQVVFFFTLLSGVGGEGKTNYTDCAALLLEGGCGSFVCLLSVMRYYVAQ